MIYKKNIILIVVSFFLSSLSLAEDNSVSVGLFKIKLESKNFIIKDINLVEDSNENGGGSNVDKSGGVFDKMKCGNEHCYGLKDGDLYVKGYNNYGQLGFGDSTTRNNWTKSTLSNVSDIAAGFSSGFAIVDGKVYSVGASGLGTGTGSQKVFWTETNLSNATKVFSGSNIGFAISNGYLYATGSNNYGQLGIGNTSTQYDWVNTNLQNIKDVAIGESHVYVLLDNGDLYVSGRNNYGQLGVGNSNNIYTFEKTLLENVTKIAASVSNGYALKDGKVYTVGRNQAGQLGIGSTITRFIWQETIGGVTDIAASGSSAYAIVDGIVYVVGGNTYGQLGIGNNISKNIWTQSNIGKELTINPTTGSSSWNTTLITDVLDVEAAYKSGYIQTKDKIYYTYISSSTTYTDKLWMGDFTLP